MKIAPDYAAVDRIISAGRTVSAMESCTGGLLISTITDRSGASDIVSGAYITYSNASKLRLGVPSETIDTYGVYSAQTAEAMARACKSSSNAEICVGITGSLGRKDPRNADSRVGIVFYSIYDGAKYLTAQLTIPDELTERADMKQYTVNEILNQLNKLL